MQNRPSLTPCRPIGNSTIKRDDKHRLFLINDDIIRFTPTEYRVLILLLENQLVDDTTLIKEAMHSQIAQLDKQAFKTLERHVENIKSKIQGFPMAIRRVQRYGYALVSLPSTKT